MTESPRKLFTSLSPALIDLYDLSNSVVVIIDVLRATSTIATALYNGAASVIPVASVPRCIEIGEEMGGITAGERDGRVAEGLKYGNSPFEYPREFIENKILVLTTTNGTKLLHMALDRGAPEIITGSFPNLSAVCDHLIASGKDVLLGCSAWKDRVNLEDTLFAGAVINRIKDHFAIHCDASKMAESIYLEAGEDRFGFMERRNATHYHRLMNYGLEKDIRYCLSADVANVLPIFKGDRLIVI
ncbi:MAG: 2-phosphosulfolactate phosphatase [Chitinophagia bacterium]|jgi:2-phosphosulfolactate phosphatase